MNWILTEANVELTLMSIDSNGDYHPTRTMTFQYYIAADSDFAEKLPGSATKIMERLYDEHRIMMQQREPNDLNYIAVVGVNTRVIPQSDFVNAPWLKGRRPQWESSNLIALNGDQVQKMPPDFFAALLNSNA